MLPAVALGLLLLISALAAQGDAPGLGGTSFSSFGGGTPSGTLFVPGPGNSTTPLLVASGVHASATAGANHRPGQQVEVNVTNEGGASSTAENVEVVFTLLTTSGHSLGAQGGSPQNVEWYGYVGGVLNSTASFSGAFTATIGVNETYQAQLGFQPAFNETGSYQICANATASNAAAPKSEANVACATVSFPHGFGFFGGFFLLIILVPIIVVVVIVVVILRRRAKRDRRPPPPKEAAPEGDRLRSDDELAQMFAGLREGPTAPAPPPSVDPSSRS